MIGRTKNLTWRFRISPTWHSKNSEQKTWLVVFSKWQTKNLTTVVRIIRPCSNTVHSYHIAGFYNRITGFLFRHITGLSIRTETYSCHITGFVCTRITGFVGHTHTYKRSILRRTYGHTHIPNTHKRFRHITGFAYKILLCGSPKSCYMIGVYCTRNKRH